MVISTCSSTREISTTRPNIQICINTLVLTRYILTPHSSVCALHFRLLPYISFVFAAFLLFVIFVVWNENRKKKNPVFPPWILRPKSCFSWPSSLQLIIVHTIGIFFYLTCSRHLEEPNAILEGNHNDLRWKLILKGEFIMYDNRVLHRKNFWNEVSSN